MKEKVLVKEKSGKWKWIALIIALVISYIAGILTAVLLTPKNEPKQIDPYIVAESIRKMSDLVTAEYSTSGILPYEEGNIPLINKKKFNLSYNATVTAGIDLSKLQIIVNDKEIKCIIPAAKVGEPVLNNCGTYDLAHALFNPLDPEDSIEAQNIVKNEIKKTLDTDELISTANEQAIELIKNMYAPIVAVEDNPRDINVEIMD